MRRGLVNAEALGAESSSPGEYHLATRALEVAERQIEDRQYRAAQRTLELAHRYARNARREAARVLREAAEQEQRIAEQERLAAEELQRQLEQQRQQLLKQQQEEERKRQARARAAARADSEKAAAQLPPESIVPDKVDHYEVRTGQSLATIAEQPEVYGDTLLWPLIYRANRDQIKTPQEISIGQVLVIPRDKNREEIEAARQEARDLNLF